MLVSWSYCAESNRIECILLKKIVDRKKYLIDFSYIKLISLNKKSKKFYQNISSATESLNAICCQNNIKNRGELFYFDLVGINTKTLIMETIPIIKHITG